MKIGTGLTLAAGIICGTVLILHDHPAVGAVMAFLCLLGGCCLS